MKQQIDAIITPLLNQGKNLGLIVGIWESDRESIFTYGQISSINNVPPNRNTWTVGAGIIGDARFKILAQINSSIEDNMLLVFLPRNKLY